MNNQAKVIAAKALRTAFNNTQRELLTESFWGDEVLIKKVREMQEQHVLFRELMDDVKKSDPELYQKEFSI